MHNLGKQNEISMQELYNQNNLSILKNDIMGPLRQTFLVLTVHPQLFEENEPQISNTVTIKALPFYSSQLLIPFSYQHST